MIWDGKGTNKPWTTAKKFPLFYHILFYGLFNDAVSSLCHTALDCDLRILYIVIFPLRQRLGPQTPFLIVCYTVRFLDTALHVLYGLFLISLWFQGKEGQYSEIAIAIFSLSQNFPVSRAEVSPPYSQLNLYLHWGFGSSRMWSCVVGILIPESFDGLYYLRHLTSSNPIWPQKMKTPRSFETPRTTNRVA